MKLATMTKRLLSISILVITACVQKVEKPVQLPQKAIIVNQWRWDDQQQNWVDKGNVFDAEAKKISEMPWTYQQKAILLEIESEKSLNAFDNVPNALLMKVFQFTDPRAFLIASKSSSGLRRLLTAEQIDPACIGIEHFIVLPGNKQTLVLDREEGARYIGVVLGYSNFKQAKIARLIPIVTLEKTKSGDSSVIVISGNRPALLKLKLSLGANGISQLDIDVK
jgi:type VI secretion system VasD/TssJ family lipoprotein